MIALTSLILSLAYFVSNGVAAAASGSCLSFTTGIQAEAQNLDHVTLNSTGSGTTAIAGVFDIAFRFCQANGTSNSRSALQLLGHGATYTKDYWAFPIQPEMYSYELHANGAGYSTLSYDLLGAGDSGKPDPFSVVQLPLHVSIAAKIAAMARAGTLSSALPPFAHIIYVAHSMGSVVLNGVTTHTPPVVDGAVLTGYTHPNPNIPPPSSDGVLQEADTTFPDRFAGLSPGYRVAPDRTAFYGPEGTFDAHVLAVDAATQDLVTIGDVVSFSLPELAAPTFEGHVLVLVGEFDGANCMGNCSNVAEEEQFYPRAASFESHIISQTGHDLNLHLSAPVTYALMLDWGRGRAFEDGPTVRVVGSTPPVHSFIGSYLRQEVVSSSS